MRIAMIGQKGLPAQFGGVERHVEDLSVTLASRGHNVTVYTRPYYTSPTKKSYKGVHLVSLASFKTKHFDAISHTLLATLHAIRTRQEIIHYHSVGPALLSFLPRIFSPHSKVIVTFHCIDRKHQKWGAIARLVLHMGEFAAVTFPHRTIVTSKLLRRYCLKKYHKKVIYVPSGISSAFIHESDASLLKRKFGLQKDGYILAASRLIPHKGIHYLIEAFRGLKTEKKLVIAGDAFFTDAYAQRLRKMAEGDDRIVFTGFQHGPALTELFANAYLFVLPSEAEGQSLTLLEAAGSGTCILASDIPENMEVLRASERILGYSFRNKDAQDLQKMLMILLRAPSRVHIQARVTKTIAMKLFNWNTVTDDVERVYVA